MTLKCDLTPITPVEGDMTKEGVDRKKSKSLDILFSDFQLVEVTRVFTT